jgi:hypothetical protein
MEELGIFQGFACLKTNCANVGQKKGVRDRKKNCLSTEILTVGGEIGRLGDWGIGDWGLGIVGDK